MTRPPTDAKPRASTKKPDKKSPAGAATDVAEPRGSMAGRMAGKISSKKSNATEKTKTATGVGKATNNNAVAPGKRSTVAARRSVGSGAGGHSPLGDLTRPIARDRRLLRGRMTRWLVPISAILIVTTFGFVLFVRPVQTYFDQNRKLEERTAQYDQILTVIGQLRAEVERLKTADGVKEAAREQVGYIDAGEERVTVNIDGNVPTELPVGWPYNMATAIVATRSTAPAGVIVPPSTTPTATTPSGSATETP